MVQAVAGLLLLLLTVVLLVLLLGAQMVRLCLGVGSSNHRKAAATASPDYQQQHQRAMIWVMI